MDEAIDLAPKGFEHMPTTRIGDIDIAYTTMGDGPPFVAIMGLGESASVMPRSGELALRAPERVTKLVFGCTSFDGASAVPPTPEALAAFASIGKVSAEAVRRLFEVNFSERFIAEHPAPERTGRRPRGSRSHVLDRGSGRGREGHS